MKTASGGFCTPASMNMMTANFNTMDMPVMIPTAHTSGSNDITSASTNVTHEHNATDDNSNESINDHHNESNSSMNHEDHSSMHHHDHSSHSMSTMSQGTVMYMDGFHSALFHNSQTPPPCLNFLHPSWTLHTPTKFIFAMICVTLMGIFVEACGIWRVRCLRKGRHRRREHRLKRIRQWEQRQIPNMQGQELQYRSSRRFQREVSELSVVSENDGEEEEEAAAVINDDCPRSIRKVWKAIPLCIRNLCEKRVTGLDKQGNPKWIQIYDIGAASLHAFRALLGYLLMLSVMTYAAEFLFSAIFGMVFGRYWFVDMDVAGDGGGVMSGAVGVGGGIGGAGLGEGGAANNDQGVAMNMNNAHDGTWGGGGDPCCGIDDEHDDDDHMNNEQPLQVPLLGQGNNAGVKRRNAYDP